MMRKKKNLDGMTASILISVRNLFTLLLISYSVGCLASDKPNIIIVYVDDWGYGDLSCADILDDIRTPHIDHLAASGVRFTNGYVTAPQCAPSRAGVLTGRYQQRFGFNSIPDAPLPLGIPTLADVLQDHGYITGMVGKWHLDPTIVATEWYKEHMPDAVPNARGAYPRAPFDKVFPYLPGQRGFDYFFCGEMYRYFANYSLDDSKVDSLGMYVRPEGYRLDIQTRAAMRFIEMSDDAPFFLYLAYHGPHTPLEAPDVYLKLFPEEMPMRRRYALAMMYAIDKGIGDIRFLLDRKGTLDNTLIVFMSDNGAPLNQTMEDTPLTDVFGWDGSLNTPLTGEKGMLAEGGIRVPTILSWPRTIPDGGVSDMPVISLDIFPTVLKAAAVNTSGYEDGINLLPYIDGNQKRLPKRYLYWRFWNQGAVRYQKWKYLKAGRQGEFLFDLENDPGESINLIDTHRKVARRLSKRLVSWSRDLMPEGVATADLISRESERYHYYFNLDN